MRTTLLLMCLVLAVYARGQQSEDVIAGCLTGEPGNFTLGAVPSGNIYRLSGDNSLLNAHRQQLVRVTGSRSGAARAYSFSVKKVEVLADTCTADLPPENENAVRPLTGKTGVEGVAVNETDTRTAGEVTPGWQTEAGLAQQPGEQTRTPSGEGNQPPPDRGKLAPTNWDQVGQDQQTADTSAAAAQRAEQRPNHTLGVDAMPDYASPDQREGPAATSNKP